jgi:hypothetical protein
MFEGGGQGDGGEYFTYMYKNSIMKPTKYCLNGGTREVLRKSNRCGKSYQNICVYICMEISQ